MSLNRASFRAKITPPSFLGHPRAFVYFSGFVRNNSTQKSVSTLVHPCWNCSSRPTAQQLQQQAKGEVSAKPLQCPSCKAPQPPTSYNYFEVFSLKPAFRIPSAANLKLQYYRIQKDLHPDHLTPDIDNAQQQRYGWKVWKQRAEDASSFVNLAYDTLKDPLKRSQYILTLLNQPIEETTSLPPDDDEELEFLDEWMDMREVLSDTSAESADDRGRICRKVETAREALIKSLAEIYDRIDIPSSKPVASNEASSQQKEMVERAWRLTIRLKYLSQLDRACQQIFQ